MRFNYFVFIFLRRVDSYSNYFRQKKKKKKKTRKNELLFKHAYRTFMRELKKKMETDRSERQTEGNRKGRRYDSKYIVFISGVRRYLGPRIYPRLTTTIACTSLFFFRPLPFFTRNSKLISRMRTNGQRLGSERHPLSKREEKECRNGGQGGGGKGPDGNQFSGRARRGEERNERDAPHTPDRVLIV